MTNKSSYVPGEIVSSNRQNPIARQRNHTIHDVVVFPMGLWDFSQEIRGIKLGPVYCHPASFSHHST